MAITFVADGGYASSASSPVILTKPAGTNQNDLLVMFVNVQTTTSQGTISTPAGWALVASTGALSDGVGSVFNNTFLFTKLAGGSEPANYAVSYNTGGTLNGLDGNIRGYRGASGVNSSATIVTASPALTAIVPALIETFRSGEWYAACAVSEFNDTPSVSPALSDTFSNAGAFCSYFIGDLIPSSAPGAETFTYAGSHQGRTAIGASILPVVVVPANRLRQYLRR